MPTEERDSPRRLKYGDSLLDDIPERLAPYEGMLVLLRRMSGSIDAGEGAPFPTFFAWHRPDLCEFVVCRLEDWAGGSRK